MIRWCANRLLRTQVLAGTSGGSRISRRGGGRGPRRGTWTPEAVTF